MRSPWVHIKKQNRLTISANRKVTKYPGVLLGREADPTKLAPSHLGLPLLRLSQDGTLGATTTLPLVPHHPVGSLNPPPSPGPKHLYQGQAGSSWTTFLREVDLATPHLQVSLI